MDERPTLAHDDIDEKECDIKNDDILLCLLQQFDDEQSPKNKYRHLFNVIGIEIPLDIENDRLPFYTGEEERKLIILAFGIHKKMRRDGNRGTFIPY